ncbi:LOW QUALITY PROTEIN: hypothetical protein OSB04_023449 [Centaurea solstitialis]|uniref:CCHC-type domain-containing protein n=1 Tax=Centaurea solstitialis TaxID=347529 RepID=A0AA38VZN1_9ASTR|nr:LOW QUALITY PROTEIN: hypothetical protein OSB04_023449 [Centaurea solstitialis]
MVIDACFILEFLYGSEQGENLIRGNVILVNSIFHDLLLLENQIPFFVLQIIFDCTLSLLLPKKLLLLFLEFLLPFRVITYDDDHHLTISTRPSCNHSVVELVKAGVVFKPNEKSNGEITIEPMSACFPCLANLTLRIPVLYIYDSTELFLRNTIAYEQCTPNVPNYVTSYACAMDFLVEDAEDLVESKIVVNTLGSNEIASDMLNNISKQVLKRKYFNRPWSLIALIGGLILFALTIVHTIYTIKADKLTGPNFLDWERNLMIVLRHERKWYVLEDPLGEAPPANAPAAARNAHKKHSDDLLDVACLVLATMSPDLQAGLINTNAYDMICQLRDMFQTQARTERYDATKSFNECKMIKGTSVSDHVMKMKRHLDHLERLGHPVPLQLATDTILNSLSEDYRPFVVNYNMNNMEKSIAELQSMLKTAELNMGTKNKTKDVLMVRDEGVKKKHGHTSTSNGKGPVQAVQSAPKVHSKGKGKGKGKKVKPNKARTENRCFTCNEVGHWRQNCPKRHEVGVKLVFHSKFFRDNLSWWEPDKLLNNSYKCCRLKVAQIFDRVANIGRDPQMRLLLRISHE